MLLTYLDRASLFSGPNSQLLNYAKKSTVAIDVGVQTDSIMVGINGHKTIHDDPGTDITEEDAVTSLPASALASVLKWSKDIAADIHLFSGISVVHCQLVAEFSHQPLALQRLTEIATGQLFGSFLSWRLSIIRIIWGSEFLHRYRRDRRRIPNGNEHDFSRSLQGS